MLKEIDNNTDASKLEKELISWIKSGFISLIPKIHWDKLVKIQISKALRQFEVKVKDKRSVAKTQSKVFNALEKIESELHIITVNQQQILTRLHEKEITNNLSMTLPEAAIYLKISSSSLYKMTASNKINFIKPNGKNIYFQKADLDAWLIYRHRRRKMVKLP